MKLCRHPLQFVVCVLSLVLLVTEASAQQKFQLSSIDRVRLAEAFHLADELGDRLWPNWSKAPFAVLLVTPEREFLLRHPQPTSDFIHGDNDSLLRSDLYWRNRVFQPNLLATFPAVGGVSTIVIGQAENTTAKSSSPWLITLLHEHF